MKPSFILSSFVFIFLLALFSNKEAQAGIIYNFECAEVDCNGAADLQGRFEFKDDTLSELVDFSMTWTHSNGLFYDLTKDLVFDPTANLATHGPYYIKMDDYFVDVNDRLRLASKGGAIRSDYSITYRNPATNHSADFNSTFSDLFLTVDFGFSGTMHVKGDWVKQTATAVSAPSVFVMMLVSLFVFITRRKITIHNT